MKTSDGYFTTGSLLRGDLRIGTRAIISVPSRDRQHRAGIANPGARQFVESGWNVNCGWHYPAAARRGSRMTSTSTNSLTRLVRSLLNT